MSRSKAAHKREKKRRHERQIAAGERVRKEKIRKPVIPPSNKWQRKTVRLSEIDREIVKEVLRRVSE